MGTRLTAAEISSVREVWNSSGCLRSSQLRTSKYAPRLAGCDKILQHYCPNPALFCLVVFRYILHIEQHEAGRTAFRVALSRSASDHARMIRGGLAVHQNFVHGAITEAVWQEFFLHDRPLSMVWQLLLDLCYSSRRESFIWRGRRIMTAGEMDCNHGLGHGLATLTRLDISGHGITLEQAARICAGVSQLYDRSLLDDGAAAAVGFGCSTGVFHEVTQLGAQTQFAGFGVVNQTRFIPKGMDPATFTYSTVWQCLPLFNHQHPSAAEIGALIGCFQNIHILLNHSFPPCHRLSAAVSTHVNCTDAALPEKEVWAWRAPPCGVMPSDAAHMACVYSYAGEAFRTAFPVAIPYDGRQDPDFSMYSRVPSEAAWAACEVRSTACAVLVSFCNASMWRAGHYKGRWPRHFGPTFLSCMLGALGKAVDTPWWNPQSRIESFCHLNSTLGCIAQELCVMGATYVGTSFQFAALAANGMLDWEIDGRNKTCFAGVLLG